MWQSFIRARGSRRQSKLLSRRKKSKYVHRIIEQGFLIDWDLKLHQSLMQIVSSPQTLHLVHSSAISLQNNSFFLCNNIFVSFSTSVMKSPFWIEQRSTSLDFLFHSVAHAPTSCLKVSLSWYSQWSRNHCLKWQRMNIWTLMTFLPIH